MNSNLLIIPTEYFNSFKNLQKKYENKINEHFTNTKWKSIFPNKFFFHVFLDKIYTKFPYGHPKQEEVRCKLRYYELCSSFLNFKELTRHLLVIKDTADLDETSQKVIENWKQKSYKFLAYAAILDGIRSTHSKIIKAMYQPNSTFNSSLNYSIDPEELNILVSQVITDIQALKVNEELLLPAGSAWHEAPLTIQKNENGNYTIIHYNTDRCREELITLIKDISPQAIENKAFWHEMFSLKLKEIEMDKFNKLLLTLNEGSYPDLNSLLQKAPQKSKTCSFKSLEAVLRVDFIRASSSPEEGLKRYKMTKSLMRNNLIKEGVNLSLNPLVRRESEHKAKYYNRYFLWTVGKQEDLDLVEKDYIDSVCFILKISPKELQDSIASTTTSQFQRFQNLHNRLVTALNEKGLNTQELDDLYTSQNCFQKLESVFLKVKSDLQYREHLTFLIQREINWQSSLIGKISQSIFNFLPIKIKNLAAPYLQSRLINDQDFPINEYFKYAPIKEICITCSQLKNLGLWDRIWDKKTIGQKIVVRLALYELKDRIMNLFNQGKDTLAFELIEVLSPIHSLPFTFIPDFLEKIVPQLSEEDLLSIYQQFLSRPHSILNSLRCIAKELLDNPKINFDNDFINLISDCFCNFSSTDTNKLVDKNTLSAIIELLIEKGHKKDSKEILNLEKLMENFISSSP
jgi:hypothetical protein